ncbi:sulfate respiration complex hexadecaheme cytochrome HmcA [Desulfobacula phenolica]|uniref:Cytochrome c7 n=1 Tax=Desulfobacula phenolica TaxID=90732 RepID=A0A1H2DUC6_9BACT|nr:cytochrome c3 family protein [Desulfobacula phenolica]SDT86460.1 Cytochrome c7 [Desulfobacula phenolica]
MSKVKSFQLIFFVMIVLCILFPFIGQTSTNNSDDEKKPGLIKIELEDELGKDEMPAVGFLHDLHTQASDGDCTVCHMEKDNTIVFEFKRTGEKASMDFYHDQCIACHTEKKASAKKTGPVADQCGACHVAGEPEGSLREKISFDKSLHFIHESSERIKGMDLSAKDNCSACHHKYNEKTKEIFYVKGEEESCFYCHKSEKKDETRSIQEAAHDSCVACHQSFKAKSIAIDAGPVTCDGCHDNEKIKKIKKITDIPRLKRNQPDEVAITGWKADDQTKKNYMDAVAFDHKFHETAAQSCKDCHHETLKKCNDCHGAEGGEQKGGFVSLGQAMHKQDSTRSCIGCHKDFTKSADCAGCHSLMPASNSNPESCKTCHSIPPVQLESKDPAQAAKTALTDLSSNYTIVAEDKIPETVVIDGLADEYKPSRFPHRKVVQAIAKRVEKSGMANAFHKDQAGLCMGCHHNSPKTLEPPKCASCHSKVVPGQGDGSDAIFDGGLDGRPGLKGAYHGQCITCHQKMDIKSVVATDCVKCHEAKK